MLAGAVTFQALVVEEALCHVLDCLCISLLGFSRLPPDPTGCLMHVILKAIADAQEFYTVARARCKPRMHPIYWHPVCQRNPHGRAQRQEAADPRERAENGPILNLPNFLYFS